MINTCAHCGLYRADKTIDPAGPYAVCPECGHQHPFLRLPLFVIGGASGTGKSTVCQTLSGKPSPAVVLDADILWRPEFNTPETNYRDFFETWLRMAKNISQSGRPVALFGAGVCVPENIEPCIERRYFSQVHYLALTCSEEALVERLRQRPAWRETHHKDFIEAQARFNRWFQAYDQQPTIEVLDTTHITVEIAAQKVQDWIMGKQ